MLYLTLTIMFTSTKYKNIVSIAGGGSKESDDEEGNAGAAKPDDADDDAADKNKQMLPLVAHAHTM